MWFRRDLRLEDNTALEEACHQSIPVLPLFIFDSLILNELPPDDARVSFIYNTLFSIDQQLKKQSSGLLIENGEPIKVWEKLIKTYDIDTVFVNRDYEPYARKRDENIQELLQGHGIKFCSLKDQVIFEPHQILKKDGTPYSVFTPFKNKWMEAFLLLEKKWTTPKKNPWSAFKEQKGSVFPSLESIGFVKTKLQPPRLNLSHVNAYDQYRDLPEENATTFVGTYLRFGLISIRKLALIGHSENQVFLSELIWREFFMQILYHFPKVVDHNFRRAYDEVQWRNDPEEFQRWCKGTTGYPLVDAGMRELNSTGFMHNRVRMVTASFLCKHLLIDWRWGEGYFASKLFDFELSSNNGNWQWAAGTGCDAVPYFRVFNPELQTKRFDPFLNYIRKWVPEIGTANYPKPMVDHATARLRAIETYRKALKQ